MLMSVTKMQAQGNDFIILDMVKNHVVLSHSVIKHIAHRTLGIGCDQVLVLAPASRKDVDFDYIIYNQDGSESSQCGNGARCIGYYIHKHHGHHTKQWRVLKPKPDHSQCLVCDGRYV